MILRVVSAMLLCVFSYAQYIISSSSIFSGLPRFPTIPASSGWYSTGDVYVPSDAGAINVITSGAVGDGVTDDTAAIVSAMNSAMSLGRNGIVYFPKGHTYLISSTIKWVSGSQSSSNWPSFLMWQGQNQESTIIKLADNTIGTSSGCDNSASSTAPNCLSQAMVYMGSQGGNSDGNGNEGYGMYLNDLTLDLGNLNPGAEAIHWIGNNNSSINNVTIQTEGSCFMGIDMRTQYFGPALIKNVKVTGCKYAMAMDHGFSSVTLEHITLANQTLYGMWIRGNEISVRDIVSTNTNNGVPVFEAVQDLGSFEGVNSAWPAIAIYGANLSGGASGPAIDNSTGGQIALYNMQCSGFSALVNLNGSLDSACSSMTPTYFSSTSVPGSMGTIPTFVEPPEFTDSTPSDFVNVKTYGAIGDGVTNDANAVQSAIDSGSPVVYFPYGTYFLGSQITVRSGVCALKGFGASITATSGTYSAFRVNDATGNSTSCASGSGNVFLIDFTNVGAFASPAVAGANPRNTILRDWRFLDYSTASGYTSGGNVFMEDVSFGSFTINSQNLYAHQLNPENGASATGKLVCNACNAWVLGIKTENPGGGNSPSHIVDVSNQGNVFILGGYIGTQQELMNITGNAGIVNSTSNIQMFVVSDFHTWDPSISNTNCVGSNSTTPSSSFPTRGGGSPTWWNLALYNNCTTPPPLSSGNYIISDSSNQAIDAGFFGNMTFGNNMRTYPDQGSGYANQTWHIAKSGSIYTICNSSIGVCNYNNSGQPFMESSSDPGGDNWTITPVVGGYSIADGAGNYLNSPGMTNGALTFSASPQTFTIQ